MSATKTSITVETQVKAAIEKVWDSWTNPKHITQWNQASPDWHTPCAENDLRIGGIFKSTMAARDGSMSFDFWGTYTNVIPHRLIEYTMGDDRKAKIIFEVIGSAVKVIETFEAEGENSVELQRGGWQAILDSFKIYTEGL